MNTNYSEGQQAHLEDQCEEVQLTEESGNLNERSTEAAAETQANKKKAVLLCTLTYIFGSSGTECASFFHEKKGKESNTHSFNIDEYNPLKMVTKEEVKHNHTNKQ